MTIALDIEVLAQQIPDNSNSVLVTVLKFTAVDYYLQITRPAYYVVGSPDNNAASPYPIFSTIDNAIAYFEPTVVPLLISDVNSNSGATYYSGYSLSKVDPSVGAAISSLTLDTIIEGTTNKYYTATEKTKLGAIYSGGVVQSNQYGDLTGLPTIVTSVSGHSPVSGNVTLVKADVGLGSADNTSDAGKPISTATQTALNGKFNAPTGSTSQYLRGDGTVSTFPSLPVVQSYEGTTQRLNAFPIFKSGTVGSGVVAFNLTADGTSTGTALFPNAVIIDSVNLSVNDATAAYQMSWAWSNSNKTLTVTANKLTTANILTGLLGQAQANSATIKLMVWGY